MIAADDLAEILALIREMTANLTRTTTTTTTTLKELA